MNDLNRSIKIFIDGTEASAGVKKIEDAITQLENKISSLDKSESGYSKKSKTLQKELENKHKTLNTYKQKVSETDRVLKNLSGATYDELLAVSQNVRKELRAAVPDTAQYNAALEQNRRVTEAVSRAQKNMRVEVGCQASPIGKAVEMFNKYAAVVTTVIAAVTGLTLKLNQLREKRNEREDAKADVEALTGLSKDSIDWLEQQAVRLSTQMTDSGIRIRQSATEILDAYKLVGSAKPELLSNKEALAEVTEQTLILASASGMSLKDAVDAVTLSLNQYGDGADQAARYANVMAAGSKYGAAAVESVTTAVTKSGVAASSANIPIEQLVGTIETLAEKGIKDEIAGTGLKKFFLTLQTGADETNPKIVGLETALDNLQKKQLSAAQIKKMFGEEGYNVASVLINETEKVKYYTKAVTGTSVAMEQAATKSDTAAAKLAQAKNKMNEMGMELMEKLNPSIISVVNGTVNWSRKIIDLIGFMVKHSSTIITLTTAITTYYLAVKATEFYETKLRNAKLLNIATDKIAETWSKIRLASTLALSAAKFALSGNIKMATTAMRAFNTATKGNLIALVASAVIAAAMAFYKFFTRTSEAEDALNSFLKASNKERDELRKLTDAAGKAGDGTQRRKELIEEINSKYGQYLTNLLDENSSLKDIKKAYNEINTAMEQNIAKKILNERSEKISRDKKIDQMKDVKDILLADLPASQVNKISQGIDITTKKLIEQGETAESIAKSLYNTIRRVYYDNGHLSTNLIGDIEDYAKTIKKEYKDIKKIQDEFSPYLPSEKSNQQSQSNQLAEVVVTANKPTSKNTTTDDEKKSQEKLKEQLEIEKKLYTQKQAFLKEMYLEGGDETLQTEEQLQKEMECIQMEYLERSLKAAGSKSKEGIDFQNQINDLKLKMQKEHIQEQLNEEKAQYEQQQQDLKMLYASGKDDNLNSEAAYNDAMEQLTIMHLERMLSLTGLNAEQRKQVEKQLLDFKVKCMKEEQKANEQNSKNKLKTDKQEFDERLRIYQQYGAEFGNALGNIISGQENAMQGFADTMIDIMFDVITQIINAELVNLSIIGTAETAKATSKEIGSKGFLGIASGAILAGLITAGIATAKSTLKGFIGKRRDDGSSDAESTPQAEYKINQRAAGKYDVIGAEDGRSYYDIPYIGEAPTGIVKRTSLISENGAELIINSEDLSRLQKHINYPVVLQAINDARSGRVPQYAEGNYDSISHSINSPTPPSSNNTLETKLEKVLDKMDHVMDKLGKPSKNYVLLSDINDAEEIKLKSEKPFTRGDQ